ncbi:MAG: cell wall-active antibiotics response protein [FCB group bacterium]|nr:cell wall-active antibiotics response protein [FCB group bacterium]
MKRVLLISAMCLFILSTITWGRKMEHVTKKISMEDADYLILKCDFGVGKFYINPDDITEAAIVDITYNPHRVDYTVDTDIRDGKCYVDLESEHHRKTNIDSDDNIWDISLSTKYKTSMDLNIGACEANFDFGGIPLKDLKLDMGAASGEIDFSQPNPIRLKRIKINAGASSLNMSSVGNANFDLFKFSGGVGSYDLDFRGEYNGESEILLDIGLGSADIILPRNIPIRLETEGAAWLSSIDFHGVDLPEIDDDVYESPDFEDADTRIILKLKIGLGSVDFKWRK